MQEKNRILFITHELSPFLEESFMSELIYSLASKCIDNEWEVRIIMPKFGVINERRHRLHEVVRLSGINIRVYNDDFPLIIKVASLPKLRIQVYFMDNEDLFKRKHVYYDDENVFFDDNLERMVFFCKGALETVKKFGWPPDIIHCTGWLTSPIPLYLKTAYKDEPVFANTKCIYTIQNHNVQELGADFLNVLNINSEVISKKAISNYDESSFGLNKGACFNADALLVSQEEDANLLTQLDTKNKYVVNLAEDNQIDTVFEAYLSMLEMQNS